MKGLCNSLFRRKANSAAIFVLLFSAFVGISFGDSYYSTSDNWDLQNYCYLRFDQSVNFTKIPQYGLPYDDNLVCYWGLNEGFGSLTQDGSGNDHDAVIHGCEWVDGLHGHALSFNGASYVETDDIDIIDSMTISVFVTIGNLTGRINPRLLEKDTSSAWTLFINTNTQKVTFSAIIGGQLKTITSTSVLTTDVRFQITVTYDGSFLRLFVNGVPDSSSVVGIGRLGVNNQKLLIGKGVVENRDFVGTLDEIRIYNRALSPSEVAGLYAQPDPVSFSKYSTFYDSNSGNDMLLKVENPDGGSENVVLITCANFFSNKGIIFQANKSAIVNVWTNLGQPTYTTGVWNTQNFTTTLTLDASSIAELNWNTYNITAFNDSFSSISPSNLTLGYGGSQTFSFNASKGYRFDVVVDGVSQGQISSYTFKNVTAPHMVSVVSTQLFSIAASADQNSFITPSGSVSVGLGEDQAFSITAVPGYKVSQVYVDGVDQGNLTSYVFTSIKANHTIAVVSKPLESTSTPTPTATPTQTPAPTPTSTPTTTALPTPTDSPTPTPTTTETPKDSSLSTQTLIVAVVTAVVAAAVAVAFKKGFITLEVVNEEKGTIETTEDNVL